MSFSAKRHYHKVYHYRRHLINSGWSGGIVLIIFTVIALILANNPQTSHVYHSILESELGLNFGQHKLSFPVEVWINDALMAIFFFVVGLEIKREIMVGELCDIRKATLPIAAAIGGMIVPAAIFFYFNNGTDYSSGWGVPMATDIAFAIGIMSLLGSRVPIALKVFLTALAIVDDLGAIVVIALFYTSQINFYMLGVAVLLVCLISYMNRRGVYRMSYFIVPSLMLWLSLFYSGVHATISGVIIALLLPSVPRFSKRYFSRKVESGLHAFNKADVPLNEVLSNEHQFKDICRVRDIAKNSISLSQRLEHSLHPVVTFVIMPLFALTNAGVNITSVSDMSFWNSTLGLGIFFGLVVGKPLGIFAASYIAIKSKIAIMPDKSSWSTLFGVATLGGIGFTMSIFINNLAFNDPSIINTGKITILTASVTAAIIGTILISMGSKSAKK